MIIKVCGMRDSRNIQEVSALAVNWIGLIFYERSPRFIGQSPTKQWTVDSGQLTVKYRLSQLSTVNCQLSTKKVGVFVNATIESMMETASAYKLDYLQLHGNESPEDCHTLQKRGYSLIKAFPIASKEDFKKTKEYEGRVEYFLFDTRCEGYGGSGKRFDWSILTEYKGETPFLLSGGIRPENAEAIRNFRHPRFAGIDLNSGFEIEPGLKDIDKLKNFIQQILHLTVMNRITNLFQTQKDGILSVYFTAGYPNLNDTASILKALQAKGIHMVEVGIPFSNPMADGPVIQEAATQALRNGMSLPLLFEQMQEIRSEIQIPIILMGYLNPIMQYGFEKFCASCVEASVDGMIIPDLPYADYISDYKEIADRHDLKMIMLITPETSEERIRLIDAHTSGFIYMVSSAATTGAQQDFNEQKQAYFRRLNAMNLQNPRMVGFGISNNATFEAATAHSSGAIIGSKFVQLLKSEATPAEAVDKLLEALKQ